MGKSIVNAPGNYVANSLTGLGITSDSQLVQIASDLRLPPIQYIGFADDMKALPIGLSIINLGNNRIGGTHWTMLWVDPDMITYADSYGVGPEDYIIKLAGDKPLYWNTRQVQGYDESYCGVWALCFATAIQNQKNKPQALNDYVSQFHAV